MMRVHSLRLRVHMSPYDVGDWVRWLCHKYNSKPTQTHVRVVNGHAVMMFGYEP